MSVFLRNLSATRRLAVPLGDGWARILPPGATGTVPRAAMALPAVRRLLDARLAVTIERAGWDADLRQRAAARADMAALVRKAEQASFDALLAGLAPRPKHLWPAERIEWLKQRLAAGSTVTRLAAELGLTRQAVDQMARRHGLLEARHAPRDDCRPVVPPQAAKPL